MLSKKEIILIFILGIIAVVRFYFFIPKPPDFDKFVGEKVSFVGVVSDFPDKRLNNDRIILKLKDSQIKILVILDKGNGVFYGDEIKIKGILEKPDNFITNSGKEFNYIKYLSNRDIYYIVRNNNLEIISSGNGNKIKNLLFRIRDVFSKNINKIISSPESDLARGLILGDRGGFDNEIQDNFINTGTMHIVALSGYNITIIVTNTIKVFSFIFSQTFSMLFGAVFVLFFIIMAGGGATIVRAGIMAFIAIFARITGRTYFAGRALVIAGILMTVYDIRIISDMSFQLSFLATAGILFVTPKIIKWISFVPLRFGFRENLATTISATIAVLPLLLHQTGTLSFVSVPANILILSVIPYAMFFSFLTGVFGIISLNIALPFGFIAEKLLNYILFIIEKIGSLSFASTNIHFFPLIFVIIFYIFLVWWIKKDIISDKL